MNVQFRSRPYYSPSADDDGNFDPDSAEETSSEPKGDNKEKKTDWEKAYKGLQRKYDILKQKYDKTDETNSELEIKVAKLEIDLEGKDKSVNTTKEGADKLQQQITVLSNEVKAKDSELARSKIVMKEFPDLGGMIDRLPVIENPDEFRESLKELKTTIDARVEEEVKNRLKGTTVNDSEGPGNFEDTGAETLDTLYEKMIQYPAVRSPKQEGEYRALNKKYLELVQKQ